MGWRVFCHNRTGLVTFFIANPRGSGNLAGLPLCNDVAGVSPVNVSKNP